MTWGIDAALEKHADMVRRICFLHLTRREGLLCIPLNLYNLLPAGFIRADISA